MDLMLETTLTTTLLGIRFWDPALDRQVADSLVVTARRALPGSARVAAFITSSGIYAFQGLPGMRELENRPLVESFTAPSRDFIVEVADLQRRYLPVTFRVTLPLRGSGLYVPVGSPPGDEHQGFFLFSAPTRSPLSGMAIVRASLVDDVTGAPASHAFVEVDTGGERWYGIADERGQVAVVFPYPMFTGAVGLSPPGPAPSRQQWPTSIRAFYSPAALSYPPDGTIPDLASIFRQSGAGIITGGIGDPFAQIDPALAFGRELVLRSAGGAMLRLRVI